MNNHNFTPKYTPINRNLMGKRHVINRENKYRPLKDLAYRHTYANFNDHNSYIIIIIYRLILNDFG